MSKYPGPVLSLGLSGDCRLLAVGLSDGTLSVRRHVRKRAPGTLAGTSQLLEGCCLSPDVSVASGTRRAEESHGAGAAEEQKRQYVPRLDASNYRYFVRGASERAAAGDHVIAAQKQAALQPYDRLLKRFHYRDALDAGLATNNPVVVASILEELAARNGLGPALGERLPRLKLGWDLPQEITAEPSRPCCAMVIMR